MSIKRMGLVAAMESESIEIRFGGSDEDQLANGLETDLLTISEGEAEVAELEASTNDSLDVVEALESIAIALESSIKEGGLNKSGAHILSVSLEHLYAKANVRVQYTTPALESFSGPGSRIGSTAIALEGVKDQIKKVWNAIIAAIKKTYEWIKSQFVKVFGAANKIERRAKALGNLSKEYQGTPKETTFENATISKALTNHGDATYTQRLKMLRDLAALVFSSDTDFIESLASSLEKQSLPDLNKAIVKQHDLLSFMADSTEVTDPTKEGLKEASTGLMLYRSKDLFGGKTIISYIPSNNPNNTFDMVNRAAEMIDHSVENYNGTAIAEDKKMKIIDIKDIPHITKMVEEIAVDVQHYKACLTKIESIKNRVIKACEKLTSDAVTETNAGKRDVMQAMQKTGIMFPKMLKEPQAKFSVYTVHTLKSLLDVVELSLKQYDRKK